METTFIYTLSDPRTGKVRYLGKANDPRKRFNLHLHTAKRPGNYKDCWVASLLAEGLQPRLEILDEVPRTQWEFWEREYIRLFAAIGIQLTNLAEGGNGGSPFKGRKHSESSRKKIAQSLLGGKRTEATRAKQSRAAIGRVFSDEHRKNISLAKKGCRGPNLGKKFSPETCARISASKKAAFAAKKALV